MMKSAVRAGVVMMMIAVLSLAGPVQALAGEAVVGEPAPGFTAADTTGTTRSLSDFRGRIVVLEWFNHGCPFVQNHYNSGHMQELQKEAVEQGMVWISICSSAPCKQGYLTAEEANAAVEEKGVAATAVILDPDGTIGRAYGAKTTPHMFVIDRDGTLVYNGAIDDSPRGKPSEAKNYVEAALEELAAGKPVTFKTSQPYGCSVKYQ